MLNVTWKGIAHKKMMRVPISSMRWDAFLNLDSNIGTNIMIITVTD